MADSFLARERTIADVYKMASTFVFVFFLSLVLRASFSLPIALDVKTVQPNSETVLTEKTKLDAETILNLDENTKFVQSLTTDTVLNASEGVEADHVKRVRRSVINPPVHCPDDTIRYGNQCLTPDKYNEINDGPGGGDDYVDDNQAE